MVWYILKTVEKKVKVPGGILGSRKVDGKVHVRVPLHSNGLITNEDAGELEKMLRVHGISLPKEHIHAAGEGVRNTGSIDLPDSKYHPYKSTTYMRVASPSVEDALKTGIALQLALLPVVITKKYPKTCTSHSLHVTCSTR